MNEMITWTIIRISGEEGLSARYRPRSLSSNQIDWLKQQCELISLYFKKSDRDADAPRKRRNDCFADMISLCCFQPLWVGRVRRSSIIPQFWSRSFGDGPVGCRPGFDDVIMDHDECPVN